MKNHKAFTLIELLVVMAVIGLIASIVLVNLRGVRKKATIARGLSFSQSIYHALGAYAVAIYRFETIGPLPDLLTPDASGYGNTLRAMPNLMRPSPTTGIINNAFLYNNVPSRLNYFTTDPPSTRNFNFSQTNEITIETWFKMTEISGPVSFEIIAIADVSFPIHFAYRLATTPDLNLLYHLGDSTDDQIITDFTFEVDKWYHIAMTIRRGEAEIYINGKSVRKSREGVPPILPDGVHLLIGSSRFIGIIDEVRIYNQAFNL